MEEPFRIRPLGDGALVVQAENRLDEAVHQRIMQLFRQLQQGPSFIIDLVPAYCSLTVFYDVLQLHSARETAFEKMKTFLLPLLNEPAIVAQPPGRQVRIPVCYAAAFAPDLGELANEKGLLPEEVVRLHTGTSYRVYMLGFLPGFPYMGTVDDRIARPRKSSPRQHIPAGSVGIAGRQTGIYTLPSPGGWNIIGRTPLLLFDAGSTNPVLLQPGDVVTFYSITEHEFNSYQSRPA